MLLYINKSILILLHLQVDNLFFYIYKESVSSITFTSHHLILNITFTGQSLLCYIYKSIVFC